MNKYLDTEPVINENHEEEKTKINSTSSSGGLKRMALNDTKAGMKGLDVEKINQIIEDASRGSKFYIHQQKEQDKLNIRMQCIRDAYENLSVDQIQKSTSMVIFPFILFDPLSLNLCILDGQNGRKNRI